VEAGETPVAALQRELREELGIESDGATEITRYEFAYPGKNPIQLIFLRVTGWHGEIEGHIFEEILWCNPRHLREYDFLEGDIPFLDSEMLFG
jgi:8-oxo-dGTP diphosphatase